MPIPSFHLHIKSMLGKPVTVKIRLFRTVMKGILNSVDQYSNILLEHATEYELNEETGEMTERLVYEHSVLLRGDSIISVSID